MEMAFLLPLLLLLLSATSNAAIFRNLGVNYGQLGDNLPSPAASVRNLLSLGAGAVKIYDANHTILAALSGTRLKVSIMLPNELIPTLAANRSASDDWIATNILPFHSATRIRYLLVGNEILSNTAIKPTWPLIVPAMTNLQKSLRSYRISGIKMGTTLAMDALQTSYPPSSGEFKTELKPIILPLLKFLKRTSSYYFVDAYPYFAWAANSAQIDLNYSLFMGNSTTAFTDPGSKLTYTNLLDQMLDAVIAAMRRMGYAKVKLAVAETGWPNGGDVNEIGANVYNAAMYNRNLARRLAVRTPAGTPARPGAWMPVFVFSLYNENEKPGAGTERHWGVLYPNSTKVYPVDLAGRLPDSAYPPLPLPTNNEPYKGTLWCVVGEGKAGNATAVAAALSYACGQGNGTCDAIQPGGRCFQPDTVVAHARYAFNSYWQQFRRVGGTCDFGGLAVQTVKDPSYGFCNFPSSTN